MASNPPIDAVPLHLRTSNPQDHILRYLSAQAPFIPEFIVKGREHIDRCLVRDAKREKERKERADEEEKEMKAFEGSEGWSGTFGSSRTSGIVQRMRKKDGSCPGSSSSPGDVKRGRTRSGPVVVVLKRSEVEQGFGRTKHDRISGTNEGDKENRAPTKSKNKMEESQDTQMLDKMLGITLDRPVVAQSKKKEGVTKPKTKKKPMDKEEADIISMTSSAERRHDRKMRRRVKAAIRHTPSKPLYSDSDEDEDEDDDQTHGTVLKPSTSANLQPERTTSKPQPTGLTETRAMKRKRNHSVGLTLMANFKSDSLSKDKRLTLQGTGGGGGGYGAKMIKERGFLGGKALRSGGGYKVGVYKGGEGKRGVEVVENKHERGPPSSPPSKMRRPDDPARIKEQTNRKEPDHGGKRRSARLSQASSSVVLQHERPAPFASPSWPETRTGTGSSPGQARAKAQSPIGHDDPPTYARPHAGPENKAAVTMTTTTTTRSSSAFKSIFHIRTDTPVDLDRKSPSRSRSSLRIRGQVEQGDEVLLRQALRPLRRGLGNVTREKERSWFKPPKVRVEARLKGLGQGGFDGEVGRGEAGGMMRIEQDDRQDFTVREIQGGFDFGPPVGMYELELGGQVGRDDRLDWDEDQVDVGLMDLDEVDYPEMNCRDDDDQQDEDRMIWDPTLADDRMIDYHEDEDEDGDEEMVGLVELGRPVDEEADEIIDMFGTRVRDLEKEMYGGLGLGWRR